MLIVLQAVTNFVMYKFGSLKQADWQMMYDLAKMFLYCFNHWKLETPSVHARSTPSDNQRNYKENYSRYKWQFCAIFRAVSARLYRSLNASTWDGKVVLNTNTMHT